MEASLIITAVFNNQILVEKFLEEATDDIRDSMQFRLVKRTFRDACHAILRRNQRETKIEYIKRECKNREEYLKTSERVYINYHPFKISNVENYFHLLKNVANVNIETVVTKNLWKLKKSFQKTLHNYITNVLIGNDGYNLSQLIGMDEICKEPSEDFFVIPNNCVEYGPLRIDHLKKSFPDPREFEKLIVTDYLLDDIANSCIESSNSKEDCYKTLSDLVPSNISCKTLILKISEGRKQWRDPNQNPPAGRGPEDLMAQWIDPYKQREMPREVLEFMLKQWAVQSISLKFVTKNHQDSNTRGEWTRNAWFTKLCFKDFMETKEETDFKVKEVLVDLTDSCCLPHFRIYGGGRGMQPGLVSNIRKVFFCDKVIIRFPHVHPGSLSIEDITEGIMNDIFSEEQEKLDVEVIYYSRTQDDTTYFIDLWNLDYEKLPQVFRNFDYTHIPDMTPEWHYLLEGHDFNKVFVKKEWIGSGCRMINRRKKCTVEWKTFVEKNPLRMERSWNGAMHAGVFGMF